MSAILVLEIPDKSWNTKCHNLFIFHLQNEYKSDQDMQLKSNKGKHILINFSHQVNDRLTGNMHLKILLFLITKHFCPRALWIKKILLEEELLKEAQDWNSALYFSSGMFSRGF